MSAQSPARRRLLGRLGAAGMLGTAALLPACAHRPAPPAGGQVEEIADNPLDTSAANQAATFRNIDRLAPTRTIRQGGVPLPLPRHALDLAVDLTYAYRDKQFTVDEFLRRRRVAGLLVLKDGRVALERYAMGNSPQTRWTSFSVAKSFMSTLVGAALQDGSIASLDDTVGRYVVALRGSAYGDSPLRDLLCMTSGVQWEEDYSILHGSDILRFARAIGERRSGAVMELIRSRPRAAPSGSVFNYSTGDTYVLGAAVAAATGGDLSSYLSKKIWARLGMEHDAYWLLDSPDGLETGGNEISATLRDYGRFGLFFLADGRIGDEQVLPAGWRDTASRPRTAIASYGQVDDDPLGFGYLWWSFPEGAGALPYHDGAFTAQGIFGQFLYINPRENVVAVVWSAWRSAWDDNAEMETYALLGAAVARLQGQGTTARGPG
jgi:CubicO group peptidase (beta-lactamase class C family)